MDSSIHLERNLVEAHRRISDLEKLTRRSGKTLVGGSRISTSSATAPISGAITDHRLLSHLNSSLYMHISEVEYEIFKTLTNDHGSLYGLADNDHPQYILHSLADDQYDMLVADTDNSFVKKSLSEIRQLISPRLYPESDSVNAVQILKSDGETAILIVDTANSRVGINTIPSNTLHVLGDLYIENGDIIFSGTSSIQSLSGYVSIEPDTYLLLSGGSDELVVIDNNAVVQSEGFASSVNGWRIKNNGEAEFQTAYIGEITAKVMTADAEQSLAGSQIITKSVAILASNFAVPVPGNTSNLIVKSFSGYPSFKVFADSDYIRLRYITRESATFDIADCWGTVAWSSTDMTNSTQTYIFTRSSVPNCGSANFGQTIYAGALALDYGVSGNGFIETTAV